MNVDASPSPQSTVAKYASQFRGNSQHDALEFLLWLLDRVHEDANESPNNNNNTSSSSKTKANAKVSPSEPPRPHTHTHTPESL